MLGARSASRLATTGPAWHRGTHHAFRVARAANRWCRGRASLVTPPNDSSCSSRAGRRPRRRGRSREVRLQQAALLPTSEVFDKRGTAALRSQKRGPRGPIRPAPRRPSGRSSATVSSTPMPRPTSSPRSFVRPDFPSAPAAWNASSNNSAFKKNLSRYRPGKPKKCCPPRRPRRARLWCPATPAASNGRSVNSWPTRLATTASACGCSLPNCSAWEPGTCCAAGRTSPARGSSPAWPCS